MNQDFETLRDELERALGGLDHRQTQLRPGGDAARWSIQQTVGHLLKTYAATENAMDARIAKASATKAKPSIAQRVGQAVIIRAGLFPPGRTAPEMVCPAEDEAAVPSGVLIERVSVALKSLDARVAAAEKIFGAQDRTVNHVILGPLSISQWRRFHLIHGRHHMKVIARVRREFGA
jgi:hypothetical protein